MFSLKLILLKHFQLEQPTLLPPGHVVQGSLSHSNMEEKRILKHDNALMKREQWSWNQAQTQHPNLI